MKFGLRETLMLGGACCLACAGVFARHLPHIRERVRPKYVQMGIVRGIVQGMETAAEQPSLEDMPKGLRCCILSKKH